jgi:hypothetical protein
MGFLDSIKSWFRTEAAEARDLGQDTMGRMEADLNRREAELNLTPEERFDQLQQEISDGDSALDALRDKIEGREAVAEASADVADLDRQAVERAQDVLDLDSEEITPPEPPPGG